VTQQARNLSLEFGQANVRPQLVIHDRDSKVVALASADCACEYSREARLIYASDFLHPMRPPYLAPGASMDSRGCPTRQQLELTRGSGYPAAIVSNAHLYVDYHRDTSLLDRDPARIEPAPHVARPRHQPGVITDPVNRRKLVGVKCLGRISVSESGDFRRCEAVNYIAIG
jgi:hypothetical protein